MTNRLYYGDNLDMPTLGQSEVFLQWNDALVTGEGEIGERSHKFLDKWMAAFIELVETHSG